MYGLTASVPMWPRITRVLVVGARDFLHRDVAGAARLVVDDRPTAPAILVISAAVARATISELPPGANGTTKRTALFGHVA